METADLAHIREQFDQKVRERFVGAPIERIEVLKYGDDPQIEPGHLLARVIIETPDDEPERRQAFEAFHDEHRAALHELRSELDRLPTQVTLQFTTGGEPGNGKPTPVIQLGQGPGGPGPGGPGGLTPVMARLGPEDLETLDTLITVGIASSRAEAVRWALARIRERPAFAQLRAHTREIEALKSQF
ncbi:MAG TPA: hypothetical protein VHZ33_12625 [Trebonia sp.]|jgi:hypothetical protein|nr:hypothetical protein [Trebonia sp.]